MLNFFVPTSLDLEFDVEFKYIKKAVLFELRKFVLFLVLLSYFVHTRDSVYVIRLQNFVSLYRCPSNFLIMRISETIIDIKIIVINKIK